MIKGRLYETTPEIDAVELSWWERFSDLEDRFCWVQPASVHRILRGHYVGHVMSKVPPDATILELGCGTGWLCRLMAALGAQHVVGLDFSPSQIQVAQRETTMAGLDDLASFICARPEQLIDMGQTFDAIIAHGFLHHLSTSEIQATVALISALLNPRGRLFIVEPFRRHPSEKPGPLFRFSVGVMLRLSSIANPHSRWRRLAETPRESSFRKQISQRDSNVSPRGPSPKEIPFIPGELDALLAKHFTIVKQKPCMLISHLVVQEWLLRAESLPKRSLSAVHLVARIAALLDRLALAEKNIPTKYWVFELLECVPHRMS
ncbi:MAG: class I SAM-dependent methyltransferase [Caldilineaceae bacterium]|nr:class I SAM-dependent methyltransferase [Caldilineaceae bacterium]